MCAQRRLKSACASAQSDPSFSARRNFTSLASQRVLSEDSDQTVNAQADLNLHWVHIFKGTFSPLWLIYDELSKIALRKHAYSNILKILPPKNEKFQIKNPDIFHTSAQNIDCGYSLEPPCRGGSNEYPQSMF